MSRQKGILEAIGKSYISKRGSDEETGKSSENLFE